MVVSNGIDTSFAPWSLMVPDKAVSRPMDVSANIKPRKPTSDQPTMLADATPNSALTPPSPTDKGLEHEVAADDSFMFGEDGLTFGDMLDTINPLHHLPVVGPIYRELTGDEISPAARMAGGTIFGGPIGFVAALANVAIEETSGDDIGGTIFSAFTGGDTDDADTDPALANAPQNAALQPVSQEPLDAAQLEENRALEIASLNIYPRLSYGRPAERASTAFAPAIPEPAINPENRADGPAPKANATRISDTMAAHLAMLARRSDAEIEAATAGPAIAGGNTERAVFQPPAPAQPSVTDVSNLELVSLYAGKPTASRPPAGSIQGAFGDQDGIVKRHAAAFAPPPMPSRIDGERPAQNPFMAYQAQVSNSVDVAALATSRYDQPYTTKPAPAERTNRLPGQVSQPNPAQPSPISNPVATPVAAVQPANDIPGAMLAALKRYEALKGSAS